MDLPEKAVIITAGDSHSAALLESGRVFAWGSFRDSHGTMGLTPSGIQKVPVELVLPTRVLKLASGADHLALLTVDGQVYTCGCGEQGQLGRLPERSAQRNNRLGIGRSSLFPKKYSSFLTAIGAAGTTVESSKNNLVC